MTYLIDPFLKFDKDLLGQIACSRICLHVRGSAVPNKTSRLRNGIKTDVNKMRSIFLLFLQGQRKTPRRHRFFWRPMIPTREWRIPIRWQWIDKHRSRRYIPKIQKRQEDGNTNIHKISYRRKFVTQIVIRTKPRWIIFNRLYNRRGKCRRSSFLHTRYSIFKRLCKREPSTFKAYFYFQIQCEDKLWKLTQKGFDSSRLSHQRLSIYLDRSILHQ